MIIVTLRMKVPGERHKQFLDSAPLIAGPTKVQPGCISCGFFQDLNDPDAILFIEEWQSRKGLENHGACCIYFFLTAPSWNWSQDLIVYPEKGQSNDQKATIRP